MPNEKTILEPKYRRIFRSWTDEKSKTSFDVIVNMTRQLRRATAIVTRRDEDGTTTSEFAVVREDIDKAFATCELWHGNKITREGKVVSESNRLYIGQPNYEVSALFVSECYVNTINCYNQTSSIGEIATRIIDFVKMEAHKKQSKLG